MHEQHSRSVQVKASKRLGSDAPLRDRFPRLFAISSNPNILVADAFEGRELASGVPLTTSVLRFGLILLRSLSRDASGRDPM